MNPVRVKAYCDRCSSRLLYNACRFPSGQTIERFLCPRCGTRREVAEMMKAAWRRRSIMKGRR